MSIKTELGLPASATDDEVRDRMTELRRQADDLTRIKEQFDLSPSDDDEDIISKLEQWKNAFVVI